MRYNSSYPSFSFRIVVLFRLVTTHFYVCWYPCSSQYVLVLVYAAIAPSELHVPHSRQH
jgi:hypothetical protein